ncbi:MFS transporter [Aurantibacillus circumpalustris]|uniref:MFS transporter n=1 Tax=Aurantibacillus circumpalustris TaxID=3036359 RepID=UPI00295B8488|nr:MFS transporter [Aurantibacillus circumpalustris]
MNIQKLPFGKQILYGFGMMGWSIMINLISVILVYLYLPPESSGLPKLITQVVIFGFFNVIAIVTASGRLVDAIVDPFIAQFSDRSKNPKGRRIPMMKWAIVPSIIFCCLIFYPLKPEESNLNIVWLAFALIGFYVSSTTYIIPYNALLPELAPTAEDKVRMSTFQSLGYVMGIGISSNVFNLTNLLQTSFQITQRISALQISVVVMTLLAGVLMLITVLVINEKKHSVSVPSAVPLKSALLQTLRNKNFLLFIVADFSYFIAVTIITSGLMYFVTVLLPLQESVGNKLMITMVLVSFIFYPIVNYLAKRIGKKRIVIVSLGLLSLVFLGVFFLGRTDFRPLIQIYSLIAFAAIPLASLNILPNAILAEIIAKDSLETKENKEAIYFAVRYFFVKIAQTFGIALFAMLLIYGKDVGNDLGIRLNGVLGFVLCFLASLIFTRFKEPKPST